MEESQGDQKGVGAILWKMSSAMLWMGELILCVTKKDSMFQPGEVMSLSRPRGMKWGKSFTWP